MDRSNQPEHINGNTINVFSESKVPSAGKRALAMMSGRERERERERERNKHTHTHTHTHTKGERERVEWQRVERKQEKTN